MVGTVVRVAVPPPCFGVGSARSSTCELRSLHGCGGLYRVVVAGPVATWWSRVVVTVAWQHDRCMDMDMEYENETNKVLFAERLRLKP